MSMLYLMAYISSINISQYYTQIVTLWFPFYNMILRILIEVTFGFRWGSLVIFANDGNRYMNMITTIELSTMYPRYNIPKYNSSLVFRLDVLLIMTPGGGPSLQDITDG